MTRALPIAVLLGLFSIGSLLPACRGDTPEAAFKVFVTAIRSGDRAGAWACFSSKTQTGLQTYLDAQRTPGTEKRPAQDVLFDSNLLSSMREILYIDVLTQSGGRAVLEVVDEDEEKQQVNMVLEEGKWRVELNIPTPPIGL